MEWYEVVEQAMKGTKFENDNGDKIEWDNELGVMCYLNDPRLYSLRLLKQHKWKRIEGADTVEKVTITKERYDGLIRAEEQIKNQKSALAIEMERVSKELEKLSIKSVIDIQKYTRQNPCSTDELVAEIRDARMYIDDSQIDEVLDALGYIGLVEFNKTCKSIRTLSRKLTYAEYLEVINYINAIVN